MDVEKFRENGKQMIDFICNHVKNIQDKQVAPTLDPGFLKYLLPGEYQKFWINFFFLQFVVNVKKNY